MITPLMCLVCLIGGGFMLAICKVASLRTPLPPLPPNQKAESRKLKAESRPPAPSLLRFNPRLFL